MDTAPLDYARRRRRVPRAWVLIGLIALATFAVQRYGAPWWRRASLAYHVREARAAFAACQQLALPNGVVLYADRGATSRMTPMEIQLGRSTGSRPPPPDVPPRVAKPPSEWMDLARHVRAAASLDRASGTFTASAAAGLPEAMLQRDEAVLFVGNPQGPPADPTAQHSIVTLTATPHELRWTFSAQQHLASTRKPGELSFNHPNVRSRLCVGIVRREPTDRIEWMAAKLDAPGVLVAPYRINGRPGQLTMRLTQSLFEADATDGWVSASVSSPATPVWYLGSPEVALVRVMPTWEHVELRKDLLPHALAIDPATQQLIALALVGSKRTRVEAWRMTGGGAAPELLAAVQLNRPSDYVRGLLTADAKRFAAVMHDQAQVFELTSGRLLATCELPPRRPWDLPHVGLSENGSLLVGLAANGKSMSWWDVNEARQIAGMTIANGEPISGAHQEAPQVIGRQTFAFTRPAGSVDLTVIESPWAMPRSIANLRYRYPRTASPCGRWIAATGHGDQWNGSIGITIYDWRTGATLLSCGEIGEYLHDLVWSGDGRRVAGESSHHIFVCDLPTRLMMRIRKPRLPVGDQFLALSSDGTRLAIASEHARGVYHIALPPTPLSPTTSSTRSPS